MLLIRSDARHLPLADESVQCCVTSPPYWGLRSYHGGENMIGLEPTFEQHLENLVAVFREVRRVLRKDGTVWLNYGDAYASNGQPGGFAIGRAGVTVDGNRTETREAAGVIRKADGIGLKQKDLMLMPARLALALQADGWWVRSEVVWHKPNPMPESVTDRPTNAHEKVYLLTKSARYFYDAEAVRVPAIRAGCIAGGDPDRMKGSGAGAHITNTARMRSTPVASHANLRNVWTIPTQGVSAAHFATFPERLVEPCILAGTSAEGACEKCGAPWERVVDKKRVPKPGESKIYSLDPNRKGMRASSDATNIQSDNQTFCYDVTTTGWKPTCECEAPKVPCTVLDPFVGSGTVCRVATRLNRRGIGCDLGYQEIAVKRTTNVQRMLV